jgi:hypothetical protein
MPFILPDALTGDRKRRGSMINCSGGRERRRRKLAIPGSEPGPCPCTVPASSSHLDRTPGCAEPDYGSSSSVA